MRRIALSLSIVASLALLDACTGGSQGTGFSYTSNPNAKVDHIIFVNPASGVNTNVFLVSALQVATPTPTPTPTTAAQASAAASSAAAAASASASAAASAKASTSAFLSALPQPTTTPAPPVTPTPTPIGYIPPTAYPTPGSGAPASQPAEIQAIGYLNGGGVLGSVAVPSTTYTWGANYVTDGRVVTYRPPSANPTSITCSKEIPTNPQALPIAFDVQYAPTAGGTGLAPGDTPDPNHPGFALASLNGAGQTVNYYNNVAVFAPPVVYRGAPGTGWCINVVATASNGVQGSVIVVVSP